MRLGLTMRTAQAAGYDEPRDCIARNWAIFIQRALPGCRWLPVPNIGEAAAEYARGWGLDGFILSGGDDIGASPVRDETEASLLRLAQAARMPVLGVCRGAQMLNAHLGGTIAPCRGHVASRHAVTLSRSVGSHGVGDTIEVNSFHQMAVPVDGLGNGLLPLALDGTGNVEGFIHASLPWAGVMWHPEREDRPTPHDLMIMDRIFGRKDA